MAMTFGTFTKANKSTHTLLRLDHARFLVYTGGGLDGCGVGVGVASLSDEQETMKDGILMGSFRVKDLHLGLIFLFFGKEDVIIG